MPINIKWDLTGFVRLSDTGWTRGSSPPDSIEVVTLDGTAVTVWRAQRYVDPQGTVVGWEYVGDSTHVIALNK